MSTKEKARPTGGTAGQAAGDNAGRKIPQDDYTTGTGPISRLLMHGAENGLHLSDLITFTDRTEREVRMMIHSERRRGIPILSNNRNGYFLPSSGDETEQFIRSMRHRAREIERAADAIEKSREA